jgi:hypothetical protein
MVCTSLLGPDAEPVVVMTCTSSFLRSSLYLLGRERRMRGKEKRKKKKEKGEY